MNRLMKRKVLMCVLGAALAVCSLPAQTVDLHTHIIIPEYTEVLKAHGAELEETFPLPTWDAGRHIAFMDRAGIRTAVLTMPAPQPYYGDTEESARCIRRVNEASAAANGSIPDASVSAPRCRCPTWMRPSAKRSMRSTRWGPTG